MPGTSIRAPVIAYRGPIVSVAFRLRRVGASGVHRLRPRPDTRVPRVGHCEHNGLLVDRDAGRRISGAEEQLAPPVDVLALLDAAPHPANEDVVADQNGKCRVAAKLVAQRKRRNLTLLERRAVAHIGR